NADTGLTRNQFLMWLGQEAAPDQPLFNELTIFVLDGAIDPERFDRAFRSVLDEVDALRSRVRRVQGRPEVEIAPRLDYRCPLVDLSGEPDPDAALDRWARAEVDRVLDLSVRPFESTLLRLGPQRYAWGLLQHHLFSDATSMALLYERVADRYARLGGQGGAPEPAPASEAPPFADYVRSELEQAGSERFRRNEAYWNAK